MRIISWNCNGRFRDKFPLIQAYDADVYVIQECENPFVRGNKSYKDFASNFLWTGENPNKGLGIFAKENILLTPQNWPSYCLRCFLPVRINDVFNLLGVWACDPYIAEYYVYQNINFNRYSRDMIIIGDFNSNVIWDKKHGKRNHSTVVTKLAEIGLVSAYHTTTGEAQGLERRSTFFNTDILTRDTTSTIASSPVRAFGTLIFWPTVLWSTNPTTALFVWTFASLM